MRNPPPNKNTIDSVRSKFSSYYTERDAGYKTPCWEWHRTDPSTGGYGIVTISGKKWKAHRLSWFLFRGEIPSGLLVCHHCDNPPCANPDHFFIGTHLDNCRDAESKKRITHIKGIAHPLAKLDDEKVRFIRSNFKPRSKDMNSITLAKRFGVQKSLIYRIVKRISWPHVE